MSDGGKLIYPGTRNEFYTEYGGLPNRRMSLGNIFIIAIIVLVIIVIITGIFLLLTKTSTVYQDHTGYYNLDTLIDANNSNTQCCVRPGLTATSEAYIYDTVNAITYSRDKPTNINTVCNTFPNPAACIAANTDASGNIIPHVTFAAQPYYTFEKGLFIGCGSTAPC